MNKTKSAQLNYATPGAPLDKEEFEQMIKKAQQGPFYSIGSVKAEFLKWKAKYSK